MFLILFFVLLILLPLVSFYFPHPEIRLFDSFYRVGSLVFGGGHVVLPLLQNEMVSNHWTTNEVFMNGYGAAQAIPGPLFAFAAYLGAASDILSPIWWKSGIALIAIFLPSFLLILGFFLSGNRFAPIETCRTLCPESIPQSWGFCLPHSIIRFGQVPYKMYRTFPSCSSAFYSFYSGKSLPGRLFYYR